MRAGAAWPVCVPAAALGKLPAAVHPPTCTCTTLSPVAAHHGTGVPLRRWRAIGAEAETDYDDILLAAGEAAAAPEEFAVDAEHLADSLGQLRSYVYLLGSTYFQQLYEKHVRARRDGRRARQGARQARHFRRRRSAASGQPQ